MSQRLHTTQIAYIKKHTDLGQKSPEIASALNISVWTVRKYVRRIKKRWQSSSQAWSSAERWLIQLFG